MSNYTKLTDFASKDTLPSGNAAKIVKGTEIDDEFEAIESAIATKANTDSPALSGTPTAPTASSGTNTTQIASTAFVAAAISAIPTEDAASILAKLITVDGAGSGVDADLLDGNQAADFATADHTHSEYLAEEGKTLATSSGYYKFDSGLQIAWGNGTSNSTFTFANAFDTACAAVVCTCTGYDYTEAINSTNISTTSFYARQYNQTRSMCYIAIGY